MATERWLARALNGAQTDTLVIGGTWIAGETITLTINQRSLVITIGATVSTTAIALAIKEIWNGDTRTGDATSTETGNNVPEFAEVAASVSSSTVTLVGARKGVPYTLSSSTTSVSGTVAHATPTAATGLNFWDNTANWSGGALPVSTDTVYFDQSSESVQYNLAHAAVIPAAVYVLPSFTGDIGLPQTNAGGQYAEYRGQYLQWGPAVLQVGAGSGPGSGRLKFDSGTSVCAITVFNTGTPAESNLPALIWKGTHASNSLVVRDGSVGAAVFGGETATLATVTVEGGDVTLGSGVTLSGAILVYGGTLRIASAIAGSLTIYGGAVTIEGTGSVAQLTVRGGTCTYNMSGTLSGATIVSGTGVLDFSGNPGSVTVSNPIDLYGQQCQLLDPNKCLGAVVIDYDEGAGPPQTVLGLNIRLTRGTPA